MKIKAMFLSCVVLFTSVVLQAAPTVPQVTQPAPKSSQNAPNAADQKDVVVYVTNSGTKYHKAGCRYLKSSIPMALKEASQKYSPCSVCKPPTMQGK